MFSLKILLRLSLFGLLILPLASGAWAASPTQLALQQINLLENPGFENPYTQQTNDVSVAAGWTAWWVEPGSNPAFPTACNYNVDPPSCQPYKRPIYQASGQVHGGAASQKYFTTAAIHQAGLYQQITGVTPGTAYHFSVQIQTLSVNTASGTKSAGQPSMGAQVGIDPEGGTDPSGKGILWNQAQNAFDAWTELSIDVAARSSTITVFVRTWPQLALAHNDVYVDDAVLSPLAGVVLTSGPDNFLTPPDLNITQAPIATLFATSTALPNGEIWYTIQPGDTLVRIAHLHNTTVDELRFLNNLTSNKIVSGQKMLVAVITPDPTATPFGPPTATLVPSPTVLLPPTIPPLVTAQIAANYGQLCVVAYNDLNRNAINDHEPPVSEARVTLSVGGTPLEGYVTTEGEATHCFPQLPAGTYQVSLQAPSGYTSTTASEAAVQLQAGNLVTLAFGLGSVPPTATATATPVPPEPPSSTTVFLTGMSVLTLFIVILGVVLFLWLKRK
jgi:hypothetical protein